MDCIETPSFPIEVAFTLDATSMCAASKAAKNVLLPRWFQIALPIVVVANPLLNVLQHTGQAGASGTVAVLFGGGAIYGLMCWLSLGKRRKIRAQLVGTRVTGKFWDDHLDLALGESVSSISYSRVTRVGRDADGLILGLGKRGSQWFPSAAFRTVQHRDAVFDLLAATLKAK